MAEWVGGKINTDTEMKMSLLARLEGNMKRAVTKCLKSICEGGEERRQQEKTSSRHTVEASVLNHAC